MNRPHHERGRGFTLMEALLATAILAMAIFAITMPFSTAAASEQLDGRQTLAVALAQEMMEEILAKPFDDPNGASTPGPEPGDLRLPFPPPPRPLPPPWPGMPSCCGLSALGAPGFKY